MQDNNLLKYPLCGLNKTNNNIVAIGFFSLLGFAGYMLTKKNLTCANSFIKRFVKRIKSTLGYTGHTNEGYKKKTQNIFDPSR